MLHWQTLDDYGADAGPRLKQRLSTLKSGSSSQPLHIDAPPSSST